MYKDSKIQLLWYFKKTSLLVGLYFFCTFVGSESLGAIQKLYFFNNKELPKGSKSERLVSQFLELSDNPKGNSAYKLFSTMSEENPFVNTSVYARFTQLQEFLMYNHFDLTKPKHFVRLYFATLPFSKSQEDAFNAVSTLHFKRHKSYKYASYKTFTKIKKQLLCIS